MQMEPWRKRGFVPDSDEEDELDSLETKEGIVNDASDNDVDLEYLPVPTSTAVVESPAAAKHDTYPEVGSIALSDTEKPRASSVELVTSPTIKQRYMRKSDPQTRGSVESPRDRPSNPSIDEQTPKPRRGGLKTYGKRSSATKSTKPNQNGEENSIYISPKQDDGIWDIPSSPATHDWSARKSRRHDHESTPKASTPTKLSQSSASRRPKVKDSQELGGITRSRSSSPDELNLVELPTVKPPSVNQPHNEAAPQPHSSEDDSPLSSPPSSIHSPAIEAEQGLGMAAMEPQPAVLRIPSEIEIPLVLLDQAEARPMQRSFRERNAIQLHPYALEMAKYQKLMKQGGIKPVRMPVEEQKKRAPPTTDESQEQDDFNPDSFRSSPPPEEFLPPARPERRQDEDTNGNGHQKHKKNRSPIQRTHSNKRRRKSASGAWQGAGPNEHQRPQVVIQRTPPTQRPDTWAANSIFDLPSSPPGLEGVSSATQTPRVSEGFRFPPGFTPPSTTTTVVQSKLATPRVDEPIVEGLDSDTSPDDEEDSDTSQASSGEPEETAEDREIRRIQRQTRGVLPASYIRLTQNRFEKQKRTQGNHNTGTQRIDGKGIAQKIVRKRGQPGRTTSWMDFGDSDDSDDRNKHDNHEGAEQDDTQKELAHAPNNLFNDDQDVMEDNRIDYMLPTVPRNTSSSNGQKGLKRPKSKENISQSERQAKRARLKRQTRLTDASYGGQRTKQASKRSTPKPASRPASRTAPRLGILDAPDVAARPRQQQPQFLRIAARVARSRRDAGRRSPTRKFVQLSSKLDTADANQSLREWKRGKIRPSKVSRPQSKPRKRQPLATLSNGHRAAPSVPRTRDSSHAAATRPDVIMVDDEASTGEEHAPTGTAVLPAALSEHRSTAAVQSKQPERQGHQWIIRRNVAISSLRRSAHRPAATSLVQPDGSQAAFKDMFSRSLTLLNKDYRQNNKLDQSLTLNRYLSNTGSLGNSSSALPKPPPTTAAQADASHQPSIFPHQNQRRRLKKSLPHRINVDADEFRQTQEPVDDLVSLPISLVAPMRHSAFSVGGLFNWQPSYSLDFGIMPLLDGIFFHESTFIGSGDFSKSLQLKKRDLDHETKPFSISFKDQTYRWGAWNETVSSQMGSVFDIITIESEQCIAPSPETITDPSLASSCLACWSLIAYVTEGLSFIDPVDRNSFVMRTMGLVSRLREPVAAFITNGDFNTSGLVTLAYYNLVFANQIHQVSSHPLISKNLVNDALDLVKACAKDVTALVLSEAGITELHRLLEETKNSTLRDTGIRENFPSATALVVTVQLLRSSELFDGLLADLQIEVYTKCLLQNQKDITILEFAWRGLFTTLPLNEIDSRGIARRGSRYKTGNDNWNLVKKLLSPALDSCDTNSAIQPISYNSYCRTLFQRCYLLINVWGWRDCKPILDTLYDFFARKLLHNLKLEESRGSPTFLDELDKTPSLDIHAGEPCFHTLLKIIASGLRFLSSRYEKKKIRNFAWRLLPNHGRVYPKEMPLRHEDLDALRNHHDLLCTLYWAVPDGCRPRLEAIRNLVHPASSHRETCNINLKSWTRLIRFKLSTNEDVSGLDPFADWHSHFLAELAQQHSNARNEIEAQIQNDKFASKELVESTISQNQRQIETSLVVALSGLRTAVALAPSLEHAYRLILKTPFDAIVSLFDAKRPRVNKVISEALHVIAAYVQKDPASPAATSVAPAPVATASFEEDSQEFEGLDDWTDIDAVLAQQDTAPEEIEYVQTNLRATVFRLVSNCFGQENCPEDPILMDVVDCWASVAHVLVCNGLQRWDDYLSPFGNQSWSQLRQTVQTRKYTGHFLAVCIEKDPQILVESRNLVMGTWISSLVERSSMLKFQHRLTTAVLNGRPLDPLLQNLPFTTDKRNDKYHITLEDLGQRRVSLLSSILSNMREQVLQLESSGSRSLSVTKQDYSELLQRLMTAMKDNYCELGNGAAQSAQGAYVEFVHRIIRFLQELTSDIKPVDPFFTDPTMFPLPPTDPRYIVAKLKRYEPKLASNKEVQTLTMFIQSIVERATVERQQSNLVDQLHTAMKSTYEAGRPDKPTLRAVLLQCVFPAYIELAFSTPAAWLLSRPIILSTSLVFRDLLFSLDTNDPTCVSSLLRIFDATFHSSYRALRPLSTYPRRFKDPVVLSMFAEILEMIASSLVVVDYIDRVTDNAEGVISYIRWFSDLSTAVLSELDNSEPGTASDASISAIPPPEQTSDNSAAAVPQHLVMGRRLAFEDHQSYLKIWTLHNGKYYYTRQGHDAKEVSLDPGVVAAIQNEAAAKKAFEDASTELSALVEQYEFFSI